MSAVVCYRAPLVVPVSRAPIRDGAVLTANGRITALGSFSSLRGQGSRIVELENSIITPALINCHCHLELSYLAELGRKSYGADNDITAWIRALLSARAREVDDEIINAAVDRALIRLRAGGVVLTADTGNNDNGSSSAAGLPEVMFFLELLGFSPQAADEALHRLNTLDTACAAHAPYSTHPRLIQAVKARADARRDIFPIHTAESAAEIEFLAAGGGSLRPFLMERLGRLDFFTPPGCGAVEYLERLKVLNNQTLCVHCVHISETEVEILARRAARVCLCPGSNRALGVGRAPAALLLQHGLRPCLGTDSLASNYSLDLWREMRLLQEDNPALAPEEIFKMATINGAMALGREEFGCLEPGKDARMLAVRCEQLPDDVFPFLVSGEHKTVWLDS
ncbi:amidohydrolase family protein [Desulfobacterota bacterium M19]